MGIIHIFTLHLTHKDYPLLYDDRYDAYWTPFCGQLFDTLIELQIWCNEIDNAIFIAP